MSISLRHFLKALPFVGSLGWLAKKPKPAPKPEPVYLCDQGKGLRKA